MDETFDLIQKLSNERHMLYRLAAKQHLTLEQRRRLDDINAQLPILWDRHRREVAARRQYHKPIAVEQRQAA